VLSALGTLIAVVKMKVARTFCSVQLLLYIDLDALAAIAMTAVEIPESQIESQMFL
jgi:hypothetical protein